MLLVLTWKCSAGNSRNHQRDVVFCTHLLMFPGFFKWIMSAWGTYQRSSRGNTAVSLLEQDYALKTGFKRMPVSPCFLLCLSFLCSHGVEWILCCPLFFFLIVCLAISFKKKWCDFCWHCCEITWYMGTIWVRTLQASWPSEQNPPDSAWQMSKPSVLQRLSVDLSFCFTNSTWTRNPSS